MNVSVACRRNEGDFARQGPNLLFEVS